MCYTNLGGFLCACPPTWQRRADLRSTRVAARACRLRPGAPHAPPLRRSAWEGSCSLLLIFRRLFFIPALLCRPMAPTLPASGVGVSDGLAVQGKLTSFALLTTDMFQNIIANTPAPSNITVYILLPGAAGTLLADFVGFV